MSEQLNKLPKVAVQLRLILGGLALILLGLLLMIIAAVALEGFAFFEALMFVLAVIVTALGAIAVLAGIIKFRKSS